MLMCLYSGNGNYESIAVVDHIEADLDNQLLETFKNKTMNKSKQM